MKASAARIVLQVLVLVTSEAFSVSRRHYNHHPQHRHRRRITQRKGRHETSSTGSHDDNNLLSIGEQVQPQSQFVSSLLSFLGLAVSVLINPWEITTTCTTPSSLHTGIIPCINNVHVHKSEALALTQEQMLVTDVWKEVTRQYLDTTYNGLGQDGWQQKRLDAAKAVVTLGPDDQERVYDVIRTMVASLGDPYTRFLTPEQYQAIVAVAKGGNRAGVGVQLQVDPKSGQVVVMNTSPKGPAQLAGIQPGDAIVQVDGMDVTTATAEVVAAKCRGPAGSNVNLAIRHAGSRQELLVTVTRATIPVNPVRTDTFTIQGKKVGLIQLSSFNQETTQQVVEAMRQFSSKVSALVLDVRGNAGGYMPAGVEVAQLFLPPQTTVISQVDKSGRTTVELANGVGSDTKVPLYILVDDKTASAAEIMTVALQDNQRATVVSATGVQHTFGKGRIQNIQEVGIDGSGIAVTKAKYMTPNGQDIHGVGIRPNVISNTCAAPESASATQCLASLL